MGCTLAVSSWAEEQFGATELSDKRLNQRFVKIMSQLALHGGGTIASACKGDDAAIEAGYRFLRNPNVKVKALMESGFSATTVAIKKAQCVLAIDDTSTVSYGHKVASQLGDTGGTRGSRKGGFWVHSTLMVDGQSEITYGLIAQHWWQRDKKSRGKAAARVETDYAEKESYKWQRNAQEMRARLGEKMRDVIAVSDRESDVYLYLQYKQSNSERFVVRAAQDRGLMCSDETLFATLERAEKQGEMTIEVPQRGGRKGRQAHLTLKAKSVTIKAPKNTREAHGEMNVNAVLAYEENSEEPSALRWIILTTEPIQSEAEIKEVLRYYRLRWRIEEFHKAWKSDGSQVESLRLEKAEHLQRMGVMLSFVAVRIMQLREAVNNSAAAERPCTEVLSDAQWKLLWMSQKTAKALPRQIPDLKWASQALAKLGGFYDSKRTGRASWATYYQGWKRLEEMLLGYTLAFSIDSAVS